MLEKIDVNRESLGRASIPVEIARRAFSWASVSCAEGACAWYHGFWPFLRTLGLVTLPEHHGAFYRERLTGRGGETARVLVCGSADLGMPDLVHAAFAATGASLEMTVLDRCATPLRLNTWWAEQRGSVIDTVHTNILEFDAQSAFDLIVTHSFLGYFAIPERQRLVRRWHRLLSPGGRVLTVHRVRPGASGIIRFSAELARAFEEAVIQCAVDAGNPLFTPAEVREMARRYATNFEIHPVASRTELLDLFEEAGFEVAMSEAGRVEGRGARRPSGPTAIGDGVYVSIEATRS